MKRTAHMLLAMVVVLCSMLTVVGTAAAAEPAMEFAVQDDAKIVLGTPETRAVALQRAREMGATHMRIVVYWHRLHARNPNQAHNLQLYKDAVIATQAAGLKVQLVFTGVATTWGCTEECMTSDGKYLVRSPGLGPDGMLLNRPLGARPRPAAFAAFVRFGIEQFHPLGVRRFSLYNEPNHGSFLCSTTLRYVRGRWKCTTPHRSARLYRLLYKASYRAAERTLAANGWPRRNVQLLIGELTSGGEFVEGTDPRTFMRRITRAGMPIYADGFALHPYQFANDPRDKCSEVTRPRRHLGISCLGVAKAYLSSLARSKRLLRASGSSYPVPLYLTEYGLYNQGGRRVDGNTRARWTVAAFDVAKAAGARQMLVYHIYNVPGVSWNTPLVSEYNKPYKVFHEMRTWAKRHGLTVQPVSSS